MTTEQKIDALTALSAILDCGVTGIYVEAAEMTHRQAFKQLARSAAAFLSEQVSNGCDDYEEDDEEERPETFEPLSLEYFVNQRTGEYIADVDLTVGGPSIWARYESRRGRITLYAAWGSDRLECSTDDCPLIDWIKDIAPAEM